MVESAQGSPATAQPRPAPPGPTLGARTVLGGGSAEWLRADVLASGRVRTGFAGQWLLTTSDPDVVLVEVDARSTETVEAPFARQREAVLGSTVPVIVWVTASSAVATGAAAVTRLLQGVTAATHVLVDDPTVVDEWTRALGREVQHTGPAVDPALHSVALTGSTPARQRRLALVGEPQFDRARLDRISPDLVSVPGSGKIPRGAPWRPSGPGQQPDGGLPRRRAAHPVVRARGGQRGRLAAGDRRGGRALAGVLGRARLPRR
ncbi:hypothetical protein LP422_01950 [Janibacter limosus]|uniref:hypothetical protein n=1 Tax=Janibacter limosus TaxID=53458 RepID=UPI0035E30EA2|nr:hypothetical protein LP422_01950 [Janibacter limosus]